MKPKMALHSDFQKIKNRFVKQFKAKKGEILFRAFLEKKGLDETQPFPKNRERKEKQCSVRGLEIKELGEHFHIEGLVATDHVDDLDQEDGIDIPDVIPKITLESFANQMNSLREARIMGVHHSEGRPINAEYFGEADVINSPVQVVELNDGHNGLYVDTKLLKSDPATPGIIQDFQSEDLNSFSITYDTKGFSTTEFEWMNDRLVRVIGPETKLYGYTAASNPVNPNAVATSYGFKEFKELVGKKTNLSEENIMAKKDDAATNAAETKEKVEVKTEAKVETKEPVNSGISDTEKKELETLRAEKASKEMKEKVDEAAGKIAEKVLQTIEIKEKVLKDKVKPGETTEVALELKEFRKACFKPENLELKEQFRRAGAAMDVLNLDWREMTTSTAESREYKNFGVNGRHLEYKSLGITTNQNTDTDYLQSSAELQDVYDPIIYNALNQATVAWNVLAKDDFSRKGNNQVQFTLKTAANTTAAFYTGNAVNTGVVTRLKYQTKFKKLQVGVSVDGDMIAAARGGPVNDVFAQEVLDSTDDMMAVLNAALFDEVGLETVAGPIGFEYITDSAGNTTLYNLTRSAANKLAPDSAGDTYINQNATLISMTNLRGAKRQGTNEGGKKKNFVYFTNPLQADLLRGKFDDSRRLLSDRDTRFGFSTDLWVDGIPVFEDTDCNTDDWFLVDLETHRAGIWVPPTIERLGKNSDSEAAFIKMYVATYNRAPRRMVQIYNAALS